MSRWLRVVALVATLSLVAAACGDDDDDDTGAPPGDATTTTAGDDTDTTAAGGDGDDEGGEALEVVAVDYEFQDVPSEVAAGLIELTFRNDGEVEHEFVLAERGDTEMEAFLTEVATVVEGGPFPDYLQTLAIPAFAPPGETVETSFLLTEGEYALICTFDELAGEDGEGDAGGDGDAAEGEGDDATEGDAAEGEDAGPADGPEGEQGPPGTPHFELGMAQALSVTAGDDDASLPDGEGSITARDYEFDIDLQAGEQTVTFRNEGPDQVHHATMFPFVEGVDEEQAATVLETFLGSAEEDGPPPPELDFEAAEGLDTGIFSAGLGQTLTLTLEEGRTYGVLCFIQDRSGGPPHAVAYDMWEIFTVE